MKYLISLLGIFILPACGNAETEAPICSAEFDACVADQTSTVECIAGECYCYLPTHPGENKPERCITGEPDSKRSPVDPWAPKDPKK